MNSRCWTRFRHCTALKPNCQTQNTPSSLQTVRRWSRRSRCASRYCCRICRSACPAYRPPVPIRERPYSDSGSSPCERSISCWMNRNALLHRLRVQCLYGAMGLCTLGRTVLDGAGAVRDGESMKYPLAPRAFSPLTNHAIFQNGRQDAF